jgi:hypothetical protein
VVFLEVDKIKLIQTKMIGKISNTNLV